jgi:S-(hydroxymethyl)glutathione dehydrogenase/alcohol dehydrogenase
MNMMTMKAAVLYSLNQPLSIIELEIPPLKRGQVLVKILYSGICRSQLMEIQGKRGFDKWLPHLLGHEGVGIVIAAGEGVTKLSLGDEVIIGWIEGLGIVSEPPNYDYHGVKINSGLVSTFSKYSIVSENRLVVKPKGLDTKSAVLFGCALPTGAGMVLNQAKPNQDNSVIVLGLGMVGFSALIMLKALAIKNIIVIDALDWKLQEAKKLVDCTTINLGEKNLSLSLKSQIPNGADVCIESAGDVKSIECGFSLINKRNGKLIFASHPNTGDLIRIDPHELISGKMIFGSWGGSVAPDRDIPIIFNHIKKLGLSLERFISKEYSLNDINQAIDDMKNGKVLRPIINMSI